jgi:hypothetical protein
MKIFHHVLMSLFLCFNGQFCEQIDGVAVDLLISLWIAKFFMEDFKEDELSMETAKVSLLFLIC